MSASNSGNSDFSPGSSTDDSDAELRSDPPQSGSASHMAASRREEYHRDLGSNSLAREEPTISGQPYPAQPNTVQFVQVPRTFANHTYRDFTNMPIEQDYSFPTNTEQMTFHEKLYDLLTYTAVHYRQVIDWCCHGRAFVIKNAESLVQLGFLRLNFGFSSMQRFRTQLHCHGYKLLVAQLQTPSSDCYYSEFLLQGMPHLLQYSPPFIKNRRRLLPDPANEPNFRHISSLFPLPGNRRALLVEARSRLQARGYFISDSVFESTVNSNGRT